MLGYHFWGAFFKDLIAKWGVNWGWVLVASRLKLKLAPKMHVLDALKAVILLCERNLFSSHTKWTWSLSSSLFPPSFQGLVLCVVSFGVQSPKGPKMPFGVPILHAHHVIDNGYTSWYFKHSRQRRNNTFSWRRTNTSITLQSTLSIQYFGPNYPHFLKITKFNSWKAKSVLH